MRFDFTKYFPRKPAEVLVNSNGVQMPSWKHRRRLIYSAYVLGAAMIIFGAFIYYTDTQVASQMIIGGVSLISIILTAYTAFATMDDKFHFREYERNISYGNASENLPVDDDGQEYDPDGNPVK